MKRKKVVRATKVAASENTDAPVPGEPANCALCHSEENEIFECQQYIINDLEEAFECKLKASDKKELKICITCSYHISILSRFLRNNVCMSGAKPLCFMCKNFTVLNATSNDIKSQLRNTPFGTQIEEKGNYYACVVCLYQLKNYTNYKHLIDNFLNGASVTQVTSVVPVDAVTPVTSKKTGSKTPVTPNKTPDTQAKTPDAVIKPSVVNTQSRGKNVGFTKSTPDPLKSSAVTPTKSETKKVPTILLHKLDASKYKFVSDLDEPDVSSTKVGRKRSRSDSMYTEVLPKKRRYEPSPSPAASDVSESEADLSFETQRSPKKTGKRVTINTRPSVMKSKPGTSGTPMKSALKAPTKSPVVKVKSPPLKIKLPLRAARAAKETTPNVVTPPSKTGRPTRKPSPEEKNVETVKPGGRPSRSPAKSPSTPVKNDKVEKKKSPKTVDVEESEENANDTIPETPQSTGRKRKVTTKNPPMKTPAEKKQMDTVHISDEEEEEGKEDTDGEEATVIERKQVDAAKDKEPSPDKILDLIENEEDEQAELIIPEDTDTMEKMTLESDSESLENPVKSVDTEKETGSPEKNTDLNQSGNSSNTENDESTLPAAVENATAEIVELINNSLSEAKTKSDEAADTSAAKATTVTTTNNGNSNSDKENIVDLLRDESNSSDFGVIKKLNNNERVQLDINMDKIFDELRTEASP